MNSLLKELTALHTIVNQLSDAADPRAVAQVTLDHVLGFLGLEVGAVFLADEKTGRLVLAASRRLPGRLQRFIGDPGSLTPQEVADFGLAARAGDHLRVDPVKRYPRLARLLEDANGISTLVHIPLTVSEHHLGSVVCLAQDEPPLDEQRLALLEMAALELATLVKHARSLARERRQRRLAETLRQVANDLVFSHDRETALSSILKHLARVMEYDGAAVLLLQGERLHTVAARGFGSQEAVRKIKQVSLVADEHPYLRRIICEGKPFLFPPEHRQDPFRGILAMKTIHSTMAAPLNTKAGVIGVLTVHKIEANWYDETDLAALEAFGIHAALAIENAELWEEVKAVSAQYVEALEQERRRISRELHDEVGQALTAAKISLEMTLRDLPEEFSTLRSRLQGVIALASETLNDVRRLAYELRPTVLDDLGLVPALQWYTDTFSRGTGLPVTFRADDLVERPSSEVETVLYRLVQEGLTNVARHAHARHVEVELKAEPGMICLRIRDDGCGFDAKELTKPWSPGQGLGLRGMRERVHLLGGVLEVDSKPGQGTELRSRMPLNGAEE